MTLGGLAQTDLSIAGGKAANLGELTRAGFDVPTGFVVTTEAYRHSLPDTTQSGSSEFRMSDDITSAILQAYRGLGGGQVAVRSSATAEDLPGATFAGQQDTFLNVDGEQNLLKSVRQCWASLSNHRAVEYRSRLGIDEATVAMAVVVQRMVQPEHAGVMFTAHPVTGNRHQVVIAASSGLGEAVVSGSVTPEHYVISNKGQILEHEASARAQSDPQASNSGIQDKRHDASLAPAAARELAAIAKRIETLFKVPQDIEWAISNGQAWILQARPMTALPPAPRRLDFIQKRIGPVYMELLPRRPYPMEVDAWIMPVLGHMIQRLLQETLGARIDLTNALPTKDKVVQEFVPPRITFTSQTPAALTRTFLNGTRNLANRTDKKDADYIRLAERIASEDLSTLDWARLLQLPKTIATLTNRVTDLRVAEFPVLLVAILRLKLLLLLLNREELFPHLVGGVETQTLRANAELSRLARMVDADTTLRRTFKELDAPRILAFVERDPQAQDLKLALNGFIREFGHREASSLLLVRDPTWGEDPTTIIELIQVMRRSPPIARTNATDSHRHALGELLTHRALQTEFARTIVTNTVRAASEGMALREDTHYEGTRLMPLTRKCIQEAGFRLAAAGSIDQPDDIWYLTWREISTLDSPGSIQATQMRAKALRRRAVQEQLAASPLIAPTTLYQTSYHPDARAVGAGAGGGTATGPVTIVRSPREFPRLQPGDVLVCETTSPAWTPLFTRAAAVVADNGGLASHAAIVAREYGIPAVMGTGNGTSTLIDGEIVTVNGDLGTVVDYSPETQSAK